MEKKDKILVYGAVFVAVLVVLSFALSAGKASSGYTQQRYENALSAELSDKCAVPPGYTEEDWIEHMGHHPDRYAECLP